MSNIRAVSIHDLHERGYLAFDLIDILLLAMANVQESTWTCSHVECTGQAATELHTISENARKITGDELLRVASQIQQVINGDFVARRQNDPTPWLAIRAIDSSYFVVVTANEQVLASVRSRFRNVRESPEDTEFLK